MAEYQVNLCKRTTRVRETNLDLQVQIAVGGCSMICTDEATRSTFGEPAASTAN